MEEIVHPSRARLSRRQLVWGHRLFWRATIVSFLIGLCCSLAARAQQSYQTSRAWALQQVDPAAQTLSPDVPLAETPVRRFLGWEYASSKGPEYLEQFLRPFGGFVLPEEKAAPDSLGLHRGKATQLVNGQVSYPGIALRPSLPAGFIPTGVAVGDFNGDGRADWVVSNGGHNNLYLYFGRGDGSAELPVILPLAGVSPVWLASGDLDADGRPDLVVAEADSRTVGVLLGNGDGTFAAQQQIALPVPPIFVVVADLNNDGNADLLVGLIGNITTGRFAALLGDGTGSLGPPIFAPIDPMSAGMLGEWLSGADVNGDGIPDVLATGEVAQGRVTRIFLGRGDGTFALGQQLRVDAGPGGAPLTGILADVNQDGCADALIGTTNGVLEVRFSRCDGTFDPVSDALVYGLGDAGYGLAAADVDDDGALDLVTSGIVLNVHPIWGQQAGNLISVLRGDGRGGFRAARVYRGKPSMFALALADLDVDGRLDVITASSDTDTATVFLNDGTGGYGDPQGVYFGYHDGHTQGTINPTQPFGLYTSDVDGDGHPDLVVMKIPPLYPGFYRIAVMLNDGAGHFSVPVRTITSLSADIPIRDYILADFRNIGRPDFLAIGSMYSGGTPLLTFAPNTGGGSFGPTRITTPPNAQGILGVGDFNRDANLDFVVAGSDFVPGRTVLRLTVFAGNGDGTFTRGFSTTFAEDLRIGTYPRAVFVGDFNRDGKLDVLVWVHDSIQGRQNHHAYQFLGNGDGTFAPPRIVLPDFDTFRVADLNGDGLPDIVELQGPLRTLPDGQPNRIVIYLGQFDGTFRQTAVYEPYAGLFHSQTLFVADFNGDGSPDVGFFQLTRQFPTRTYIQFLLGNSDGTFTPTYSVFNFYKPRVPQLAVDVNGDGRADLIEHDAWSASLQVVPAASAPALQLGLLRSPIVGSRGRLRITLNVPSPQETTVLLSASDPAIRVPPSVTIPPDTVSLDVPFDLGDEFDPRQMFSIDGQLGTERATTYGIKWGGTPPMGFRLTLGTSYRVVQPGQTTLDYSPVVRSIGGYSTEAVQLDCRDLPAAATCRFGQNPLQLPAGSVVATSLVVATTPDIPSGTYIFTVVATDGDVTSEQNATLVVSSR